jgi:hypothetical protein
MRNSAIFAAAIGLLTFVLGFAYGNFFDVNYSFHLKDWQTLASTIVAILAAAVAYIGVWNTQRVSVMTKEEERIDRILPGLRQTHDLLELLFNQTDLPESLRYVAHEAVRSIIRPQDGENYVTIVERMVPLADAELRREVTAAVFRLSTQAGMLKVMHDEIERTQADLANIDEFAPNFHDAVRSKAQQVLARNEKEVAAFLAIRDGVRRLDETIKERIGEATARREVIRKVVEKYLTRR